MIKLSMRRDAPDAKQRAQRRSSREPCWKNTHGRRGIPHNIMRDEAEPSGTLTPPCEVCEALAAARVDGAGSLVAELRSGVLLLHPDQSQKGRMRFVLKGHDDRLIEMPQAQRESFWRDLDLIVSVMREALQPLQLNVSGPLTGTREAHEVWDLVPRYVNEPHAAHPVWALECGADDDASVCVDDLATLRRTLLRGFLTVAPVRRELPPSHKTWRRY